MCKIFLETIRAEDGEVFHISYHQKRYESVLKKFGVKEVQNLSLYLNPPKNGMYRCRLTYDLSKEPHQIDVTYYKYIKRDIASLKLLYDDNIEYSLKSTCREELDKLFAKRGECDDVLIIKNSFITDTSIANIAFYDLQRWITPALPLLKGTTRQRLLEEGKIFEKKIHVDELKNFSNVALMNAMIDFDIITKNIKDFFC
ncbi:MAG: branched-chain amino acid aminotransferase [Sulfurimonas sp. RIFOXYD12_FULL_33_39]|uniref:aminotransferase class IV family protein n=1 Tax=unclassified Sulfurimonas TaxID=2623549 RepID=UPI0008D17BE4|nr:MULTISPECIES: aminotransferase class IV family protein [unclassified Sulfurimonas]OHE06330.1 MAG: branched-chain amino acid aminotransferase [Sulfurimonas sp. RIFCSPLOWO2_12_FULL_34_6]OHE09597.1 MAG: branched-chain amino acid aminotransferase [Sulfurimonas sp. RIFOXYD12_FULL_33_39]OHE13896.1 MAG: branched-chain amino acid aminotransferase [Sulfurimonas sp. RIFOXYD2_FULL_34_21]DAB28556.1 MAG TPA: branched-chain amino acid aminotransferase [Sulfurimonas sp. UBA10385]